MYQYSNGQIRLSDFKQPMGMNLKEDNRWVKRALLIPWNDIEKRYASLFTNRKYIGQQLRYLRRNLIHKNKIADLLIKSYDFRTVVFSSFSFVGNLAYAIFNIVVYGLTDSFTFSVK